MVGAIIAIAVLVVAALMVFLHFRARSKGRKGVLSSGCGGCASSGQDSCGGCAMAGDCAQARPSDDDAAEEETSRRV